MILVIYQCMKVDVFCGWDSFGKGLYPWKWFSDAKITLDTRLQQLTTT